jgi:hypothetical protein
MIDWGRVVLHAIWILGLATALASWSWGRWIKLSVPDPEEGTEASWLTSTGLAVAAAGLALAVESWWLRAGWAFCAVAYAVETGRRWRKR